jgi:4-azaleucine resistance transporter AzlC
MNRRLFHSNIFMQALRYTIPVLLGYLAIGIAFGLLLVKQGYPWWLSLVMSLVMYAGAGQYIAVGLFASGATLAEAVLVQFVVNARHIAYGISLFKRFNQAGAYKYYLIFTLTDETFALLSSLPAGESDTQKCNEDNNQGIANHSLEERNQFMFFVALLDHGYWTLGSIIGAVAGSLIPFNMEGIGFALTALFVVLLIEQILRVRDPKIFVVSALVAVFTVFVLPSRLSLLSAMVISLGLVQLLTSRAQSRFLKGTPHVKG